MSSSPCPWTVCGLEPMPRQFLYRELSQRRLTFHPDRPHTNRIYARAPLTSPPPNLAWDRCSSCSHPVEQNQTRPFCGHSYTSTTPQGYLPHLLQQMGLCFTKAFLLAPHQEFRQEARAASSVKHTHIITLTHTIGMYSLLEDFVECACTHQLDGR